MGKKLKKPEIDDEEEFSIENADVKDLFDEIPEEEEDEEDEELEEEEECDCGSPFCDICGEDLLDELDDEEEELGEEGFTVVETEDDEETDA
jgi:hypothetical protein